jgi:hypothetical protein
MLLRSYVASLANRIGDTSRHAGAPRVYAESPRETVAAWLQWCDPNGCHTDSRALAEDLDPYTLDTAWEALGAMVTEE